MAESPKEWLVQADYDLDTARAMQASGRYTYAVYMCHLAVEKALKGIFHERLQRIPPKTHDLIYLAKTANLDLDPEQMTFLAELNGAGVATRYPEELSRLLSAFPNSVASQYVDQSAKVIAWAHTQLQK